MLKLVGDKIKKNFFKMKFSKDEKTTFVMPFGN